MHLDFANCNPKNLVVRQDFYSDWLQDCAKSLCFKLEDELHTKKYGFLFDEEAVSHSASECSAPELVDESIPNDLEAVILMTTKQFLAQQKVSEDAFAEFLQHASTKTFEMVKSDAVFFVRNELQKFFFKAVR